MDRLRVYAKTLLIVLTLSQVYGNPMFFWSQQEPDCSQQHNNENNYQNYQQNPYQSYQAPSYQGPSYQAPSYQGSSYQGPGYQGTTYQGPSYQETLQAMITDTLRALCDLVQNTVRTSKQEITTLAKIILKKSDSDSNCESDETPEEEYNAEPSEPTDSSPGEPQSLTTLGLDISTTRSKPNLLIHNKNESTADAVSDSNNSTTVVSSTLKAGLNTTSISPPTTDSSNSTSKKTNSEIPMKTASVIRAQNDNETVYEVTTLKL